MPRLYGNLIIKSGSITVENNATFSGNIIAESGNTANFDLLSANTLNIAVSANVLGGITANTINAQFLSANSLLAGQISSNGLTINKIATSYLSCNSGYVTLENDLTGNVGITVNTISANTYIGIQTDIQFVSINAVGSTITFNHSTNSYPQISIFNLSNNRRIEPDEVEYTDINQVVLTFSESVSVNISAVG